MKERCHKWKRLLSFGDVFGKEKKETPNIPWIEKNRRKLYEKIN